MSHPITNPLRSHCFILFKKITLSESVRQHMSFLLHQEQQLDVIGGDFPAGRPGLFLEKLEVRKELERDLATAQLEAALAVGMVVMLLIAVQHVGLLPHQVLALVVVTVLLAGLCVWIISLE